MENLAATPEALVRPWRKAAMVLSVVAAVELVLLVAGGIVVLGRYLAHKHAPASAAQPVKHAREALPPRKVAPVEPLGRPALTRGETYVLVLNGNGEAGAAGREAGLVQARGYRIARIGNAGRANYTRSVVIYRPGFRAEAARLADDLGIALFKPLDGLTPAGMGRAQLAVVVGTS